MKTSDTINELSAALAKAQADIKNPVKDSQNPHFKNDYASLAGVLDAVREPLSKNALSLIQATRLTEKEMLLVTRLVHASGQWIESETPLMLVKNDMQGLGSAITYARRYAAAAMCGVAQADDDGEGSVGRKKEGNTSDNHDNVPPAAQGFRQSAVVTPKSVTRVGSAFGGKPA